jgi:hypothetical protein
VLAITVCQAVERFVARKKLAKGDPRDCRYSRKLHPVHFTTIFEFLLSLFLSILFLILDQGTGLFQPNAGSNIWKSLKDLGNLTS